MNSVASATAALGVAEDDAADDAADIWSFRFLRGLAAGVVEGLVLVDRFVVVDSFVLVDRFVVVDGFVLVDRFVVVDGFVLVDGFVVREDDFVLGLDLALALPSRPASRPLHERSKVARSVPRGGSRVSPG